ncbi:conjugal transfer mating-pair stabilization protein TraG [Yersinia wautersii]|uniref:conjugal transfer mating-pair stabilization protein TraG n=1 Tax=Yersinia wautersii TaxID=1341643 RepID=UPI00041C1AF0|nr:conjugal transfer mating-pair stabilization protein TraG [Yersinia wautersii]
MDVQTVYVLASGDYFQAAFNGVAALIGSSSWDSMFRIVLFVAAFVFYFTYIQKHDPLEFIKFIAVLVIVSSLLLIPKATVQIIDRSDPASVYVVDNVPVGLAVPARLVTSIGTDMTELYELIFRTPDSATYSKTGMLFGATLVQRANDVFLQNGELANLFGEYVKNCVIGDMMLNHKYSMQDLMNSSDPYTLIFSQPSPLRGVMVPRGSALVSAGFHTCEALARNVLEPQLRLDTSNGGATWVHYVSRFFGTKPDANVLFANLVGESYDFYYAGGKSASEVMRKNVTMSALRSGIAGTASRNGDTASLVNMASESSYSKMRMSWAASSSISMTFLPVMHTVLMAMLIGMFPLMILLASIHTLTVSILKGFVFTLVYLQAWPPLYAILNYAMTFYLKGHASGMDITLSNVASVQQMHSDVATMSGWLANSIPFLAGAIVFGLWKGVSQAGSYLGTATNSSTSASASNATDGTWAFNNMQMNNASGQKWDTNFSHRDGQMTSQHASGATSTRTGSGQTVYDSSTGMSKLPVHVGGARMLSSSLQSQARESEVQAQSALSGYNSSVTSGWNQLSQLASQKGNSDSLIAGSDNSTATSKTKAAHQMQSAVKNYASSNNIGESEAYNQLMDKASRGTTALGFTAGARAEVGLQVLGNGAKAYGDLHTNQDVTGTSGSSHGTQQSSQRSTDYKNDTSSQAAKDFKEGMDVLTSSRVTNSASHTDNTSSSRLDQYGATLSESQSQYQQYTDGMTRSHEYSEMASKVESMSSQIDSNFDQQFANFVTEKSPQNAHAILTDTSSPEVAAQRDKLASEFVSERLMPQIEAAYQSGRGGIGNDMQSAGLPAGNVQDNFAANKGNIDSESQHSAIRDDVSNSVSDKYENSLSKVTKNSQEISAQKSNVSKSYDNLQENHTKASDYHEKGLKEEREGQDFWDWSTIPGVKGNDKFNNKGGGDEEK